MGLVLSILGSVLPWGKRLYLPIMGSAYYIGLEPWKVDSVLGIELTLGRYAFVGAIVATVSLGILRVWRKKYAVVFVLAGGLTTLLCSLLWILRPGFLEPLSFIKFTASYGAYISLSGGLITLIGCVLNFLSERRGFALARS